MRNLAVDEDGNEAGLGNHDYWDRKERVRGPAADTARKREGAAMK